MKKILLVNETKDIYQKILDYMYEAAEVTWARCCDEALNLLKEKEFNLLIMDIEIPADDKNDFYSHISHEFPQTRIIYFKKKAS